MIIDELRNDITIAMNQYKSKYTATNQMPSRRQADIDIILRSLNGHDPVLICQQIGDYLNRIANPVFAWMIFIDRYDFARLIRGVLEQDKYREISLLRQLNMEKEVMITHYQSGELSQHRLLETRVDHVIAELALLKNENRYLYQTLSEVDKKISSLEDEKQRALDRAKKAEKELEILRGDYHQLTDALRDDVVLRDTVDQSICSY
jgi:hypothetical protein